MKQLLTLNNTNIPYRVLTIDGGGAKGFYAIGILKELENLVGCPLYQKFNLISGVSTGAFIAAGIALGKSMSEIHHDYINYIPRIMRQKKKKIGLKLLRKHLRKYLEIKKFLMQKQVSAL